MKNLVLLLVLTLGFVFYSCQENFSPKANFQEKYILNCIIQGDTSYQVAILTKSYDVNGFDPYANTKDPSIAGADIRLRDGDSVYIFRDSVISADGKSRYDSTMKIYYLKNFQPNFNRELNIEVLLPNGRRLSSSTNTVKDFNFNNQNSSKVIPSDAGNLINLYWTSPEKNTLFLPTFKFSYYKNENGINKLYTVTVPLKYIEQNGEEIPDYPVPSNQPAISYEISAITKVLNNISGNDPNKQNYSVLLNNNINVIELDDPLSKYYSTNLIGNDFTVRLDALDYTNIQGGFGIFGSYLLKQYSIKFTSDYISSFGYVPIFN